MKQKFLPTSKEEMEALGWKELDILLISGDAYIDHPSFGVPLIGRYLESFGYKVGIISQPLWTDPESVKVMGRPKLFAGISAGAIDSMLAHYTAFRKKRSDDAYTEGGKAGARPNRAIMVYSSLVKQAFSGLPVVAGGIEASLRRVSHYDFWTDSLRKSLLPDGKLDLIIYGMGEKAILEVADILSKKLDHENASAVLQNIKGTARLIKAKDISLFSDALILPSHDEILQDKKKLIIATRLLEQQVHQRKQKAIQVFGDRAVLLEEPAELLSEAELDALYNLPFTRLPHTRYKGKIPAAEMMLSSLTSHRGCGGGCSFCSLAIHQSRHISSRSKASLINEIEKLRDMKEFNGSISDIGGPSANMWQGYCALNPENCKRTSCMFPTICAGFKVDQKEHIQLLRAAQKVSGVKHVRVASGIRFDLALQNQEALNAYTGEFTGGQLKVAPEHNVPEVLDLMRKPSMELFEKFLSEFYKQSKKMNKEQYVVPYLMSAFPGCTDNDMYELKNWLKIHHWQPQQTQCFVPTPSTVATAMYYAESTEKGEPLYVAKSDAQRLRQQGILMNELNTEKNKENYLKRKKIGGK